MAPEHSESVTAATGRLLAAGHPGIELLDQDLVFGRKRKIPFVGVDGAGRLVLVLCVQPDVEDTAALVIDALAFARSRSAALARHLSSTRLRTPLVAVAWVIGRELSSAERLRLERLEPGAVSAFELVRIESQRHVGDYLIEAPLASWTPGPPFGAPSPGPAAPSSLPTALDVLPQALRELAEGVIRRVEHLDDDLDAVRSTDGIAWRFQDEVVCSLSFAGGALAGAVPGGQFDGALRNPGDVESYLGAAVQRYLSLLGHGNLIAVPRPGGGEPLLTAEELAAFDPTK